MGRLDGLKRMVTLGLVVNIIVGAIVGISAGIAVCAINDWWDGFFQCSYTIIFLGLFWVILGGIWGITLGVLMVTFWGALLKAYDNLHLVSLYVAIDIPLYVMWFWWKPHWNNEAIWLSELTLGKGSLVIAVVILAMSLVIIRGLPFALKRWSIARQFFQMGLLNTLSIGIVIGLITFTLFLTFNDSSINHTPLVQDFKVNPNKTNTKILLIGLDGATWDIILPMVQRHELPNIGRLLKGGVYGKLTPLESLESPLIWTTIATGKRPEKHGIKNFTATIFNVRTPFFQRADVSGHFLLTPFVYTEIVPVNSGMRKTTAIWNILSKAAKTVAIIGWWATWPAEEVNGIMVSDHVSYSRFNLENSGKEELTGQSFPPDLINKIGDLIRIPNDIIPEELSRFFGKKVDISQNSHLAINDRISEFKLAYAAGETYRQIALNTLKKNQPDFLAIYLQGIDIISHYFWQYMQPKALDFKVSAEEIEMYGNVIPEYYRYQDQVVGELLENIDASTVVIVLSDHGFGPGRRFGFDTVSGEHRHEGIIIFHGPGIKKEAKMGYAWVGDIAPTVLALMGLPVAKDMDGDVLTQIMESGWISRYPVRYIASYDSSKIRETKIVETPEINEEKIRTLRSLGYIN